MDQCLLYLVRHGQTDWNLGRRVQGRSDIPLNETGIIEAQQLGKELKAVSFHAVYSSPLQRAHETARIVNEPHGHPIQLHPGLQEASYGLWEGLTIEECHRRKDQILAGLPPLTPEQHFHFKSVPDAESHYEVYGRADNFFEEMLQKHSNQTLLVVTHGMLMRTVLSTILQIEQPRVKITNTAYFIAKKDRQGLSIVNHRGIDIS